MPKLTEKKLKEIRKIEQVINANLFIICAFITAFLMGAITVEFFTRGNFPPTHMNLFYVGILLIYSLHKEMLRWMNAKEKERKGELFLYGWIIFAVLLSLINFLSKNYFSYSCQGQELNTLAEVYTTTLEVGAVFILARLSKIIRMYIITK